MLLVIYDLDSLTLSSSNSLPHHDVFISHAALLKNEGLLKLTRQVKKFAINPTLQTCHQNALCGWQTLLRLRLRTRFKD